MDNINFIDFLQKAKDDSEIRDYIIENGKEGKSFCPIAFIKEKENIDDSKIDK